MSHRRWGVWALLACVALGVAAGAQEMGRRAQIVWPARGGLLYYKGTIEVALEGLTEEEFRSLLVRVEATDVSGAESVGPITLWEGWSDVPVVPGGEATVETPASIVWTDRAMGRAVLRVFWNYFPPGFRGGDFLIRAEVWVGVGYRPSRLWAQTGWHHVRLVPEESPRFAVELTGPTPQAEFGLGERVGVAGVTAGAAPPTRVWLEVMRADGPGDWVPVAQVTTNASAFEISWDTSQATLGRYHLRVTAMDGRGGRAVSPGVEVVFVPKPLRVQLTQPWHETQISVGEVLPIRGQVVGAALPGTVVVEIRSEREVARWESVGRVELRATSFEFLWDTSRLAPGAVFVRATAWDAQGLSASSGEVRVTIRDRKFLILVGGKPLDAIEPLKERVPVQFELDAEGAWTSFAWTFGDGGTASQKNPVHAYDKSGAYEVCVTAYGPAGSARKACGTVVVQARRAVEATRKILGYPYPRAEFTAPYESVAALVHQPRGAPAERYPVKIEVLINILEPVTGLILTETVPAGFEVEPIAEARDSIRVQRLEPVRDGQESRWPWSWLVTSVGPQFQLVPGTRVVIAYWLIPPLPRDARVLSVEIAGRVYAQVGPDFTATTPVAGLSTLTVVPHLDPVIALLYLRKELDGSYKLLPPEAIRDLALTAEQLRIAEELVLEGRAVPFAGDAVLKPADYLRLLACFQAGRAVLDCLSR